jgi:hypothetical protein
MMIIVRRESAGVSGRFSEVVMVWGIVDTEKSFGNAVNLLPSFNER